MNGKTYEQMAEEIINAFYAITPEAVPTNLNSEWTRRIKEAVGQIGVNNGFRVCTSGCDKKFEFESEWLYDLTWYRNNPNIRLQAVPLVMESEWSMDDFDIRFDFEKLLLANSPLKIMVFQNCNQTSGVVFGNLQAGINEYNHGVSCMFILACYQWHLKRFEIRVLKKEPTTGLEELNFPTATQPANSQVAALS